MPKPQPDLSTWLTTKQTCERLRISARTLDRRYREGLGPIRADRFRPGKKPEPVFDPADVDRIVAAADPVVMPKASTEESAAALNRSHVATALARREPLPSPNSLLHDLLKMAAGAQAKPQALMLTVPQAAEFTGFTQAYIRRAIDEGRLPAISDRGWKISRAHLVNLVTRLDSVNSATPVATLGEIKQGKHL
jgi:excisionase family DNA binding protein